MAEQESTQPAPQGAESGAGARVIQKTGTFFTKVFRSKPANLLYMIFEIYLVLIIVTKAAFLISTTFDAYFSGLFDRLFSNMVNISVIDYTLGESESMFPENLDVIKKQTSLKSLLMWEHIKNYGLLYLKNIANQDHALLKITLFLKGILIFTLIGVPIFQVLVQNVNDFLKNTTRRVLRLVVLVFKLLAIGSFLLMGAFNYMALLDPDRVWELAGIFSFNDVRDCFLQNKLLILLIFLITASDIVVYYMKRVFKIKIA